VRSGSTNHLLVTACGIVPVVRSARDEGVEQNKDSIDKNVPGIYKELTKATTEELWQHTRTKYQSGSAGRFVVFLRRI